MKNITVLFLSENFQFLEVKFSIYLNRRVFVMMKKLSKELGRIKGTLANSVGPDQGLYCLHKFQDFRIHVK